MAPYVPEEVDVFRVPHSRMKALVTNYFEMIETANFSSMFELEELLECLTHTFSEFRMHESIENRFIMKKLRSKLRQLSIKNTAVCDCHKDSRLKEMLRMLNDGKKKKTVTDRINYGLQLKLALHEFTDTFLPHMEEEEEVFMPLLHQYFSYDELRSLKEEVIQQHEVGKEVQSLLELEKWREDTLTKESSSDSDEDYCRALAVSQEAEIDTEVKTSICALPAELMLFVMSYLQPFDLGRCRQVNKLWSNLAADPQLWRTLRPVSWAQGDWNWHSDQEIMDTLEDSSDDGSSSETSDPDEDIFFTDEDADIDESERGNQSFAYIQTMKELRILSGLTQNILPLAGVGVQKVILANSRALTNAVMKRILQYCPNITHLDLTQTRISDTGLKMLGRSNSGTHLRYLNLSGCGNVSDSSLVRLAITYSQVKCPAVCQRNIEADSKSEDRNKDDNGESDGQISCLEEVPDTLSLVACADSPNCLCHEYYHACGHQLGTECDLNMDRAIYPRIRNLAQQLDKSDGESQSLASGVRNNDEGMLPETSDLLCHECCNDYSMDANKNIEDCVDLSKRAQRNFRCLPIPEKKEAPLHFLSLSGCFQVTDLGLRALSRSLIFPFLQYLDLSGCLRLTGPGLQELVSSCSKLEPHKLYYCDNILDGPFSDLASGCRNLECRRRVCCRTGQ